MANEKARAVTKSVLKASLLVPMFGILSHITRFASTDILGPDYSLTERFETAYNPWADWETQSYSVTPRIDGKYHTTYRDSYLLTPDGTLALHLIIGLIAGLSAAEEYDKKKKNNSQIVKLQKTK